MYPVTVKHSLLVAFLLYLKGLYIHSADDISASVGSTTLLSCPKKCSEKYIWTLDGKPVQLKRDQNKYSVNKKNCSLTINNLNNMDSGTYRYCKTDDSSEEDCKDSCTNTLYVKDDSRTTTESSVRSLETLTPHTTDVMIDSTGIIILSSLLVLLTLMLIGAAVWRKRKNLKRPERKESNTQNDALYAYVGAPAETCNLQKREESDVQYATVHFSKTAHRPAHVNHVQYATVSGCSAVI